jgi:ATP-dependent DNA helicase RecG
MYHSPLSERGRARLAVLRETGDGFEIAARDLEQRGPGEILGVRQAGPMRLRTADLLRDEELVPVAAEAAEAMLKEDAAMAALLVSRWLEDGARYSAV